MTDAEEIKLLLLIKTYKQNDLIAIFVGKESRTDLEDSQLLCVIND